MLSQNQLGIGQSLDPKDCSKLFTVNIRGEEFKIMDHEISQTPFMVQDDLNKDPMGLDEVIEPLSTIVDLGANTGIFSLYSARKHPEAKIYSYEPYPPNFKNLVKNIEWNKCSQIIARSQAVSGQSRHIPLLAPDHNSGAAGFVHGVFNEAPTYPSITLNDLVDEIGPIDFLKIDIEGMEYETLYMFDRWEQIKHLSVELHGLFPYPKSIWINGIREFVEYLKNKPFKGNLWISDDWEK